MRRAVTTGTRSRRTAQSEQSRMPSMTQSQQLMWMAVAEMDARYYSSDGCAATSTVTLRRRAPSSRTLTGLVPYTRWGRLTQCQRRRLPVAALIAACETSGIGEATESRNTGDRGIRSRALQHRMRQAHAALLDICDGRLTAECTADVVGALAETPVFRQSRSTPTGSVGLAAHRSMARQISSRRSSLVANGTSLSRERYSMG